MECYEYGTIHHLCHVLLLLSLLPFSVFGEPPHVFAHPQAVDSHWRSDVWPLNKAVKTSAVLAAVRALPQKGDVRTKPMHPSRWQRYDGEKWQDKCAAKGCERRAQFGLADDGTRRWCAQAGHGPAEKANLNNKLCEQKKCNTVASYGLVADGIRRWCSKAGHGPPEKNSMRKRCEEEGCRKRASHGFVDADSIRRWCGKVGHGPLEKAMIVLVRPIPTKSLHPPAVDACSPLCWTDAPLNAVVRESPQPHKGDVRPHSRDPSRWVRYDGSKWQNKCAVEGCETRAQCGLSDDGIVRWCAKAGHGPAEKENFNNKRCEQCKTFASCGLVTRATALGTAAPSSRRWCAKVGHGPVDKEPMRKLCEEQGCESRASCCVLADDRIVRWCAKIGHGPINKEQPKNKRREEDIERVVLAKDHFRHAGVCVSVTESPTSVDRQGSVYTIGASPDFRLNPEIGLNDDFWLDDTSWLHNNVWDSPNL